MPSGNPGVPRTTVQAIFARKAKVMPDGCWHWTGILQNRVHLNQMDGYGKYAIPLTKKQGFAHRLAWELYRGPIPRGVCVLHRCDVKACVNPRHLFLGTQGDNLADCSRKGRTHRKLTEAQVREIRQALAQGRTRRGLASEYGVYKNAIDGIYSGRTHRWTH